MLREILYWILFLPLSASIIVVSLLAGFGDWWNETLDKYEKWSFNKVG
jgi:hypothetical protein